MQEKLALAQALLAKLAKNDLEGVAGDTATLSALTRDARWRIHETPEYMSRSVEFERAVNALASAATGKSGDGAALAWVQVNMNCLECHRWAREAGQEKKR